jgi:triacylglycerol esterase/lipase EstA (alpha/beta hydrolase family)
MSDVVCIFLSLTLIYLIIVYAIRWYEFSNSNEYRERYGDKTIFSEFKEKGYKTLIAFALEYIYVIAHLTLLVLDYISFPFQLISKNIPSPKLGEGWSEGGIHDTHNPIILVHGYMMRGLTMYPIKWRLKRDGYKNIYLFTYSPPWQRIDEFSLQLKSKIESIISKTGAAKVDLICHSMGGLVALNYITNLDGAKNVNRLITLGTPFGGSKLWSFSISRCGKEMRPGSKFLRKLGEPPLNIKTTAIYTTFDEMVIPYGYSRLEGGNNREINNIGHVGLLFSKEVYKIIREILGFL